MSKLDQLLQRLKAENPEVLRQMQPDKQVERSYHEKTAEVEGRSNWSGANMRGNGERTR
jgi:hypothetical protein